MKLAEVPIRSPGTATIINRLLALSSFPSLSFLLLPSPSRKIACGSRRVTTNTAPPWIVPCHSHQVPWIPKPRKTERRKEILPSSFHTPQALVHRRRGVHPLATTTDFDAIYSGNIRRKNVLYHTINVDSSSLCSLSVFGSGGRYHAVVCLDGQEQEPDATTSILGALHPQVSRPRIKWALSGRSLSLPGGTPTARVDPGAYVDCTGGCIHRRADRSPHPFRDGQNTRTQPTARAWAYVSNTHRRGPLTHLDPPPSTTVHCQFLSIRPPHNHARRPPCPGAPSPRPAGDWGQLHGRAELTDWLLGDRLAGSATPAYPGHPFRKRQGRRGRGSVTAARHPLQFPSSWMTCWIRGPLIAGDATDRASGLYTPASSTALADAHPLRCRIIPRRPSAVPHHPLVVQHLPLAPWPPRSMRGSRHRQHELATRGTLRIAESNSSVTGNMEEVSAAAIPGLLNPIEAFDRPIFCDVPAAPRRTRVDCPSYYSRCVAGPARTSPLSPRRLRGTTPSPPPTRRYAAQSAQLDRHSISCALPRLCPARVGPARRRPGCELHGNSGSRGPFPASRCVCPEPKPPPFDTSRIIQGSIVSWSRGLFYIYWFFVFGVASMRRAPGLAGGMFLVAPLADAEQRVEDVLRRSMSNARIEGRESAAHPKWDRALLGALPRAAVRLSVLTRNLADVCLEGRLEARDWGVDLLARRAVVISLGERIARRRLAQAELQFRRHSNFSSAGGWGQSGAQRRRRGQIKAEMGARAA
ncbi:hypothetical protein DFH09DRAFT_1082215 [Mycena vulgaris]|nr:hypothetical protein DFH09DRAFT_1082215 [Mycena vulgaris]